VIFFEAKDYQPKVNKIFLDLKKSLLQLLPNVQIEHIGASSIPNAVSKGDLDVYVGVEEELFLQALEKIKSLGFTEKKDTLRTNELCMLITHKYNYDVAIQLVVKGSEFEDF